MNIPFQIMNACIAKIIRLSTFSLMFVAFEILQGAAIPTALPVHPDHYLGTSPHEMLRLAPLPQPIQERTGAPSLAMQKPLEMRSMHNLQYQQAQPRINSDGTANFLLHLDIGHYFDPRFSPAQIAYLTNPRPGGPVAIQIAKQQEAEDKAARDPMQPIRVLSLNTLKEGFYLGFVGPDAALEREKRQQNAASFLRKIEDHDIICLQEDDNLIQPLPSAPIRHSSNDLTIIASSKFVEIQRSPFRSFTGDKIRRGFVTQDTKGFLALDLKHKATNTRIGIINTHVNWTNQRAGLESQMQEITNLINQWSHIQHWIICGDFNISLLDLDPIKNAYNIAFDVLKKKGLQDAYILAQKKPVDAHGQLKPRITNIHPLTLRDANKRGQYDTLDYIFCSEFKVRNFTTIPADLALSRLLAHDAGGLADKGSNYFSDHLGISVELFVKGFEQGMDSASSSTSTTTPQPTPTIPQSSSAPLRQPPSSSTQQSVWLPILGHFLTDENFHPVLKPNMATDFIFIKDQNGERQVALKRQSPFYSSSQPSINRDTGVANFELSLLDQHQNFLKGTPRYTAAQTEAYTGIKPNFSDSTFSTPPQPRPKIPQPAPRIDGRPIDPSWCQNFMESTGDIFYNNQTIPFMLVSGSAPIPTVYPDGTTNIMLLDPESGAPAGFMHLSQSEVNRYINPKPSSSAPLAVPAPTTPSVAAIPASLPSRTTIAPRPIPTSLTTQNTTMTEIHPSHYTLSVVDGVGTLNTLNGTQINFFASDQKPAFDQNGKTNLEALEQWQLIRLPQNQLALYAAPRVHPQAQSYQPSQHLVFSNDKNPRTDVDVFSLNLLMHNYYRRHSGQTGTQDTPSLGIRQKAARSQFPQGLLEQFDIICLQEYDSTNALLGEIKHFNLIADKELCICYNGGSLIFNKTLNDHSTPSQVKAKAFKKLKQEDSERYYLPLILTTEGLGGIPVGIINTQLPFAKPEDSQLAQLAEITEYIRSKPQVQHWIICGDFNINIRKGGPGGLLYQDLFFNRSLPIQGASSFVNTLGLQDAFGKLDHATRVTMVHSGGTNFNTTDYIWTSGFQTIAHKTLPAGMNPNTLLTHVTSKDKDITEYFSDHFALAARLRITDSSSSSSTSSTIPGGPDVPRGAQQSSSSTSSTSSSSYSTGTAALQANLSLLYASLLKLSSKR